MQGRRILIDTNILIPAEDAGPLPRLISELFEIGNQHGDTFVVHEASLDDIERDKDVRRKVATLSRVSKYQRIGKSISSTQDLELKFGTISSPNDLVDVYMLAALFDRGADFLITHDGRLVRRADRAGLGDRVLSARAYVDLTKELYAKANLSLTFIENIACNQIPLSEPIFDSIRSTYPEFDDWYATKCQRAGRKAWVVREGSRIIALAIYKDEDDVPAGVPGRKVLKIATFKVAEDYRGGRLGEQLLRQALWYALTNNYESIFLTAYPEQDSLIELLYFYGFRTGGYVKEKERIYFKDLIGVVDDDDPFHYHRLNYPRFKRSVPHFIVPVQPKFHARLFPEVSLKRAPELFAEEWTRSGMAYHRPATSMRKVYVCNSQLGAMLPGSIALFYMSKSDDYLASQSLQAVGVVEDYSVSSDLAAAIERVSKRTVYGEDELAEMVARPKGAKILNFILAGYLKPSLSLRALKGAGLVKAQPQSIQSLSPQNAEKLWQMTTIRWGAL